MTIKDFISKACEGGWRAELSLPAKNFILKELHEADILLDPLAWKAVGKVDGSAQKQADDKAEGERVTGYHILQTPIWKTRMHRFIDHLCDGLTLEEALARATS